MMVTMSLSWRGLGASESRGGSTGWCRASSKSTQRGASGQACATPSPSAASFTKISRGWQSFIIAASSAGACREYKGTTITPSAMSARWKTAQRIELGASRAQRTPAWTAQHRMNSRFQKRAHAGHHLEIADHRLPDAFADGRGFRHEGLHDLEKFGLQIRIIHGKKKMLMPTLAHQIPNALVHGHARGRHEAGHAGHDAMVARRNHVGTRTQNGNQLKHVVVVGSKDRRTRNPRIDLAAGSGIKPFHPHQYMEYAMTLNERLSRLRES